MALYELEFREVLTLFCHTRQYRRAQEANDLDRLATLMETQALCAGAKSEQIEELTEGIRGQAAALREPEMPVEPELTAVQRAYMAKVRASRG